MTLFYASYVALWLLLIIMATLILLVYRHFGLATLGTLEGVQRDGLKIGEKAQPISGVSPTRGTMTWQSDPERPTLLLFATPGCEPCATIMPYVIQLQSAALTGLKLNATVVVPGDVNQAIKLTDAFGSHLMCIADNDSGAFDSYRIRVTPFGFIVGEDGRIIAKSLCSDPQRLRELLSAAGLDQAASVISTRIEIPHRADNLREEKRLSI